MEYNLCDAKPLCQQNKLKVIAANNPARKFGNSFLENAFWIIFITHES